MSTYYALIRRLACVVVTWSILSSHLYAAELHAAPELYEPQKNGSIVVLVSGNSGPAFYRNFASEVSKLGYYTVLVSGRDVLIRPNDPPGKDGVKFLQEVIDTAQQAPKAVPGKVALIGFSRGGAGVLRNGPRVGGRVFSYYRLLSVGHAFGGHGIWCNRRYRLVAARAHPYSGGCRGHLQKLLLGRRHSEIERQSDRTWQKCLN